jgi:hypothetical protein
MAEIQERITAAKQAGYDDAAITQHLLTMPEYGGKVQTALDAGYTPNEILTYLSPPPASPGTEVLPGGAVVMAPAPSKFLRTPPPAGQVLQDVGGAAILNAAGGAFGPQILKGRRCFSYWVGSCTVTTPRPGADIPGPRRASGRASSAYSIGFC